MIETFPPASLGAAVDGLGINLGSFVVAEWAYAEAKSAGCSEVRAQIAWANVEDFDEPGTFDLSSLHTMCQLCERYQLRPLVVAGYAPPWRTVEQVQVVGTHPVGSTSVTVDDASNLQPGRDHLGGLWYEAGMFGKPAYYGSIVHGVAGNVVELGAATIGEIPDGTLISVNRLLYPSVDALVGSASAARYADYVEAMADVMAEYLLPGARIEVWNEPPWTNDSWDNRSRFYDDPASKGIATWVYTVQPLVLELVERTMPAGVELVNGGPHKSGGHGMLRYVSAADSAASDFVADAAHPYGAFPEVNWWNVAGDGLSWGPGFVNLVGSSNMAFNAKVHKDNPTSGLELVVSETGTYSFDEDAKRAYDVRHLVGAWTMKYRMVTFYSLADTPGLAMMDGVTKVRRPVWDDLRRLMRVLRMIERDEDRYELPEIEAWLGEEWRLSVFAFGPAMVVYQRTIPPTSTPVWPRPAELRIADGPGELLALGLNDRGHQARAGRKLFVGAKPMVITRKVA